MNAHSEYETLYGLRDLATGKMILYYWASSQKHKALFSSYKKAEDATKWISEKCEIVTIK